ncbi:MAG: hypothetical protein ACE5GE_15295 [Phycisphaerae bacterium]
MVKKTDLVRAARAIRVSLDGFVGKGEVGQIRIFESSPGHIRVIVGSNRFKNKGIAERQDLIWDYLRSNVPDKHLALCLGVHPLDNAEYEAEFFPQSSSAAGLMMGEEFESNE